MRYEPRETPTAWGGPYHFVIPLLISSRKGRPSSVPSIPRSVHSRGSFTPVSDGYEEWSE